ncbi:MAG: hypothetical protein H6855_06870 [Rhodospirillales bacterium]|nr:hypothetical protein [Rhodospirillales bacterium]
MNLSNEANKVIAKNPGLGVLVEQGRVHYIIIPQGGEMEGMIDCLEMEGGIPVCEDYTNLRSGADDGFLLLGYHSLEAAAAVAHAVNKGGSPDQEPLIGAIYHAAEKGRGLEVKILSDRFEGKAESYRKRMEQIEGRAEPVQMVSIDYEECGPGLGALS